MGGSGVRVPDASAQGVQRVCAVCAPCLRTVPGMPGRWSPSPPTGAGTPVSGPKQLASQQCHTWLRVCVCACCGALCTEARARAGGRARPRPNTHILGELQVLQVLLQVRGRELGLLHGLCVNKKRTGRGERPEKPIGSAEVGGLRLCSRVGGGSRRSGSSIG